MPKPKELQGCSNCSSIALEKATKVLHQIAYEGPFYATKNRDQNVARDCACDRKQYAKEFLEQEAK